MVQFIQEKRLTDQLIKMLNGFMISGPSQLYFPVHEWSNIPASARILKPLIAPDAGFIHRFVATEKYRRDKEEPARWAPIAFRRSLEWRLLQQPRIVRSSIALIPSLRDSWLGLPFRHRSRLRFPVHAVRERGVSSGSIGSNVPYPPSAGLSHEQSRDEFLSTGTGSVGSPPPLSSGVFGAGQTAPRIQRAQYSSWGSALVTATLDVPKVLGVFGCKLRQFALKLLHNCKHLGERQRRVTELFRLISRLWRFCRSVLSRIERGFYRFQRLRAGLVCSQNDQSFSLCFAMAVNCLSDQRNPRLWSYKLLHQNYYCLLCVE